MIYQSVKSHDKKYLYLFLIPSDNGFSILERDRVSKGWTVTLRENSYFLDIPVFKENE